MFNTIILLGTLTGILLAIGWFFAGFWGMVFALIMAMFINFFSYWYSDRIVLKIYRAKPTDDHELNLMVERLAIEAKIPKPRVYKIPMDVPNAFATGRDPRHSVIAVTESLMELNKDELEAVLAHEIGHIKNRDVLVSTLAATIAGAISYLAQIGYWSLFFGGRREGGNILGLIFIIIFAPIAALLIRLAISRSREYKADYTGAVLTKKPHALASALRRISLIAKEHPIKGSSATSHMWIVNPFQHDWFTGLFSTHPPIQKRIEKLNEMYL
jgi:heat shock protein HtpX